MHVRIREREKKHASDKSGCRVGWLVGSVLHTTRSRCTKTPRAIIPYYDREERRREKRRHEHQRVHECKQMGKWQQDVFVLQHNCFFF